MGKYQLDERQQRANVKFAEGQGMPSDRTDKQEKLAELKKKFLAKKKNKK
jgi:hypothetical protein